MHRASSQPRCFGASRSCLASPAWRRAKARTCIGASDTATCNAPLVARSVFGLAHVLLGSGEHDCYAVLGLTRNSTKKGPSRSVARAPSRSLALLCQIPPQPARRVPGVHRAGLRPHATHGAKSLPRSSNRGPILTCVLLGRDPQSVPGSVPQGPASLPLIGRLRSYHTASAHVPDADFPRAGGPSSAHRAVCCWQWHPDKNKSPEAEKVFIALSTANEVCSNHTQEQRDMHSCAGRGLAAGVHRAAW